MGSEQTAYCQCTTIASCIEYYSVASDGKFVVWNPITQHQFVLIHNIFICMCGLCLSAESYHLLSELNGAIQI